MTNVENIIHLMEGVINTDEIDSPKAQYKKWGVIEHTDNISSDDSRNRRALKFTVAGKEEAGAILSYFEKKGCSTRYYSGSEAQVKSVIFLHN